MAEPAAILPCPAWSAVPGVPGRSVARMLVLHLLQVGHLHCHRAGFLALLPPLLASTTRSAAVASGGGGFISASTSPSLRAHSSWFESTTSSALPTTNTCLWPSAQHARNPAGTGVRVLLLRVLLRFLVLQRQLALYLIGDLLFHVGRELRRAAPAATGAPSTSPAS